jgi:integration host factor subunit beta
LIKSELVRRIASANPGLYERDAEKIVDAILEEIASALARGDRVEIRGFGAFSVKQRAARLIRNPRTGVEVPVHEKYFPTFRPGRPMHELLNRNLEQGNSSQIGVARSSELKRRPLQL